MTYRLFIDDEREPPNDGNRWEVVRSSADAIAAVTLLGLPDYISFDHDLGGEDKAMTFLHWLVTHCLDNSEEFTFEYYIHSQNPIGKKNIDGLINSYKQYCERNKGNQHGTPSKARGRSQR